MLHPLYVHQGRQYSVPCIWKQTYFMCATLLLQVQYLAVAHDKMIWWFPVWGHICIYSFSQSQSGVCLNSLGQGHPRSAAYHTTDWHQGWMCHPHCHSAAQLSVQLEFFTPSWHCRASRLTKLLSVRAHLTFQVKGWSFGLIWFINHGRSCNESELILKKTKPYLGIACAGSVANAAAVSTCWFLAPVCGGLTAFKFS